MIGNASSIHSLFRASMMLVEGGGVPLDMMIDEDCDYGCSFLRRGGNRFDSVLRLREKEKLPDCALAEIFKSDNATKEH